ncbi:hypothetical protein RFI_02787, partial [Reticulomyxa filosa]
MLSIEELQQKKKQIETELLAELNENEKVKISVQERVWKAMSQIKGGKESDEMLRLMLEYISNVLQQGSNPKHCQIRVGNKMFQKKIGTCNWKWQAMELFRMAERDLRKVLEDHLIISEPASFQQISKLSDVWFLLQVKLWLDAYDESYKRSKPFKIPDLLSIALANFFQEAVLQSKQSTVHEIGFQTHLMQSLHAVDVRSRYDNYATALSTLPQFFAINNNGLDDFYTSWVCCKLFHVTYFGDSESTPNESTYNEENDQEDSKQTDAEENNINAKSFLFFFFIKKKKK